MSIVFNILEEELQRLKQLSQKYIKEINKLPKGSISLKKRFNKSFAYLAYRQNNKVKFKYLGGLDSSSLAQLKEKIQRRKQYELKLKQVLKDINEISRVTNARKKSAVR